MRIYHRISSLLSTGPSLQMRLLPYLVWHEQPMHTPEAAGHALLKAELPMDILFSHRACTAHSMGSGPQAYT